MLDLQKEEFFLPSDDYMFKRIFAVDEGAVDRLKSLISEVLNLDVEEIEELTIRNGEIPKEDIDNRSVRLDILATMKLCNQTEIINIEMQRVVSKSMFDRALFHWTLSHQLALLSGEKFGQIRKTISIWLLSQNIDEEERYHRIGKVMDIETHNVLSEKLELHFVELSKLKPQKNYDNAGKLYLQALALKSKEEFDMLEQIAPTQEMKDLAYRIKVFNKDIEARDSLLRRRTALIYEYQEKELQQKLEQKEREAEQAKQKNVIAEYAKLFVKEFYKSLMNMPKFVKDESGGTCTPTDFFVVAAKSTVLSIVGASQILSNQIEKMLELGGTIEDVANEVEADPQAVQVFYEKYKSIENA